MVGKGWPPTHGCWNGVALQGAAPPKQCLPTLPPHPTAGLVGRQIHSQQEGLLLWGC